MRCAGGLKSTCSSLASSRASVTGVNCVVERGDSVYGQSNSPSRFFLDSAENGLRVSNYDTPYVTSNADLRLDGGSSVASIIVV